DSLAEQGGRKIQRSSRYEQRVVNLLHDNFSSCRHAWPNQMTGIVDPQDGLVDSLPLHEFRAQPNIVHLSQELLPRKSENSEVDLLSNLDPMDIDLVHVDLDLQMNQVFGDHKQSGGLAGNHDKVGGFDLSLENGCVPGGTDCGPGEIYFGDSKIGFGDFDIR